MAKKKTSLGEQKCYVISTDHTDNPKLCAKILRDGRESLYLDYYFGYRKEYDENSGTTKIKHERKKESLNLYVWQSPRTPMERQENRETLEIAKRIRFEKGQQLLQDMCGYRLRKSSDLNFIDWMHRYVNDYNKADWKVMKRAKESFIESLENAPEYAMFAKMMKPEQLSKDMVLNYVDWLNDHYNGETPHTMFARFKKMIRVAIDKDLLIKNPTNGIKLTIDIDRIKKDVLSQDEIKSLVGTHYEGENPIIRNAFIFCLYTGIRFCDVKELTFENVDYANKILKFEQMKVKGHSSSSGVVLPLSDSLIDLIGTPDHENRKQKIFKLPSSTMCNKALRHWTNKAEIEKHITWHCARHSLGTNLIASGQNPIIVSKILGHSDLKMTEKYIRISDQLKRDALASLPELNL